jgi:hypothetical protein
MASQNLNRHAQSISKVSLTTLFTLLQILMTLIFDSLHNLPFATVQMMIYNNVSLLCSSLLCYCLSLSRSSNRTVITIALTLFALLAPTFNLVAITVSCV